LSTFQIASYLSHRVPREKNHRLSTIQRMSTIRRNKQGETRGVPECTRKEQAVRVACQAQRTLSIPVSNLTILYSRKHQKIVQAWLPVELITFSISLMELEQNAIQETQPPAYNPRKNGGTFKNSDLSWHFHLAADGRWTRQMAEPRPRRRPRGYGPRNQWLTAVKRSHLLPFDRTNQSER
jgi:hypothetical protein